MYYYRVASCFLASCNVFANLIVIIIIIITSSSSSNSKRFSWREMS